MTRPARQRSPLAHGPDTTCGSCRRCPSCTGHTPPLWYRVLPDGSHRCTRCEGTGVDCLNLVREPAP